MPEYNTLNSLRYKSLLPHKPGQDRRGCQLSAGDVILTSEPFVYTLSSSLRGLYCDYCLAKKTRDLQRCSGCRGESYCGRECQAGAWKLTHKFECSRIRRILPKVIPDTARIMAKVIIRLKTGGDQLEEKVVDGQTRRFKGLMNHYSDIKKDKSRQEHLESLSAVLLQYLGEASLPNPADLQGIFGRIAVNSFGITDTDHNTIGTGVYLAASVFDHSCRPNAFVTFQGKQLTCRAIENIPNFSISKVRISYIDVLTWTEERVKELEKRYYFSCDCPGCHDPATDALTSTLACGTDGCTGAVYVDESLPRSAPLPPCSECGRESLPSETRAEYLEAAAFCREQVDQCKDQYFLDISLRGLERQGSLFHRFNLLRVRLLDAATEAAISLSNWDLALEYGKENLPALRHYYGERHPNIGMMLLKLGKVLVYVRKQEEALRYLTEAQSILKISHGTNHHLYANELAPLIDQARQELEFQSKFAKKKGRRVLDLPLSCRTTCG